MTAHASCVPDQVNAALHVGCVGDPLAAEERGHQQHDANAGGFGHLARTDVVHPCAHQQRDGNGRGNREQPPRTVAQRVDDDEREHGQKDDHDREDGDHGGHARDRVDFLLRHLAQRLAVAADRRAEHDHVLHGAAEHDAGNQPDRAGQKPELGGQRRADERPRAGDGREMMARCHPLVGRTEVAAVVEALGRSRAAIVEAKHRVSEVARVEAIRHQVGAYAGDDEPPGADGLAARQGQHAEGGRAEHRNHYPDRNRKQLFHGLYRQNDASASIDRASLDEQEPSRQLGAINGCLH